MPAIRLAEIPNALPRSAGASGANIQPPGQPGFVVRPQVAQLDGAAMLSAESPGRAARNMLAQTLEQEAFTAEARAAGDFGRSLEKVGSAAMQWGERFAKAKDTADLAKAETIMRGVFEKQQTEQLDLPPDQWGENWTRNMDIAKKEMSKIKFSNNAMEQFAPSWERWSSLSQVQIGGQQRKAQLGEMRTSIEAAATQRLAAKDFAGAFSLMDKAVQDGTYSPAEGEMFKARAADNELQQARADNLNRLAGDIQKDPWAIKPQLERRAKGEEVPELGDITVMQANTLLNNAEVTIRGKVADQDDEADQAVLTGAVKDPKQLRERFPKLSERRLLEHEKTMRAVYDASPEGWARVTAARPKLLSAIETYDPAKDDWQMSAYYTLKDQIKSAMPPGEQAEMLELIVKKRREGNKLPAPVQDAVKTLDKLAESGWFGKADPKKLESKDPATRAAEAKALIEAGANHKRFQDDFLDWAKKNPDMARDREKVQKQLQIMVGPKASQQAFDFYNSAVQKREDQRRIETDAANTLNFGQGRAGELGAAMFSATDKARDQLPKPTADAPQVSLDFNDVDSPSASGVEIVVRKDASDEEKQIAAEYTDEVVKWFASKGVTVPNRGVKTENWQGHQPVNRFHTEPFFAKDKAARDAIVKDAEEAAKRGEPSEYARLLVRTLGRIPNVTFIMPHQEKGNRGASTPEGMSETDFARKYIYPSLALIQEQQGKALASK